MGTYSFQLSLLSLSPDYGQTMNLISLNPSIGLVSHVPKFGDASKSPEGDTASPARGAASPLEMRIPRTHIHISRRRHRISKLRDM